MTTIEQIRAEIKRKIEDLSNPLRGVFGSSERERCNSKIEAYKEILAFLDTLSKEPDKSLEEAADDYIGEVVDTAGHPGWDWETHDIIEAFIAGAKWQEEAAIYIA